MKPYIVVEGKSDAAALKRFLPPAIKAKCRFIVGKGRSSAISDARTLLVLSKEPVALVVDADTNDPSQLKKQKTTLRQLLQSAAAGINCEAFLAIPTMDSIVAKHGPVNEIPLIIELTEFVKSNTQHLN
jgi:hypothetical protein